MATVTLTLDEYEALRALIGSESVNEATPENVVLHKSKRKPTAANRAYAKAFKKLKSKYMKKSGGWKKNGFADCCKASHKMCKK